MKWTSAVAIYLLIWVLSAFFVLPFFARSDADDKHPLVAGQSQSAPQQFEAKRIAWWTTIVGTTLFALYYANYVNGWVTAQMLDLSR